MSSGILSLVLAVFVLRQPLFAFDDGIDVISFSSPRVRAVAYALLGFTCWVIGDTFMKLAAEKSVPAYQIMLVGGIGGLASIFGLSAVRGNLKALRPNKYLGLLALAVMFMLNYFLWVRALSHLPLASFYTILFLNFLNIFFRTLQQPMQSGLRTRLRF